MIYLAVVYLVLILLVGWCLRLSKFSAGARKKGATRDHQLFLAQQARDKARVAAIEECLMEWLRGLQLPQLEEQTKLRASARQLRIVLVEKLVRGPRVD